jgi:hypothetical protein
MYVAERFVEECTDETGELKEGLSGSQYTLMDLLTRVYRDNLHNRSLLERVLDIADNLVRAGVWAANRKLDEVSKNHPAA